jgi:hypothetical protein
MKFKLNSKKLKAPMRQEKPGRLTGKARYVRATAEEAGKKMEELGTGDFFKLRVGSNPMLILPLLADMGLDHRYPWLDVYAHYCGGRDVLDVLGLKKRPDDLPLAHACLKHHKKKRCEWDTYRNELLKSRHVRDKELGSALYAGCTNYANIVELTRDNRYEERVFKPVGGVQPFRFSKKIAIALLGEIQIGNDFSDYEDLLVVNIQKIKTGKDIRNVEYNVSVLSRDPFGPMLDEWDEQMQDLNTFMPPIPTKAEIEDTIDQLETLAEISSEVDDVGSDLSDYVGRGQGRKHDDKVPF